MEVESQVQRTLSLSPAVAPLLQVYPSPWSPGGHGPQEKPLGMWMVSKHCTPGWQGLLRQGEGRTAGGLDLPKPWSTLAWAVTALPVDSVSTCRQQRDHFDRQFVFE